ncbi:MAG: hypothetical protein OXN83_00600, partial [Oligoflexia bacterium]|nr:hypothetical protein [Oligoflexia bacterium]
NRNWKRAIENYSKYLKTPSSNGSRLVQASFSIAEIYEKKLRNLNQAHVWYQKTLGLYRRLKVGVSYGARAHFYIVKKSYYDKFSALKIPANPKKQEQVIAKKLKFLKDLETALKPVIRYDDGEQIVASLALIGLANQDLAKAIYLAPVPKGLNKKGQEQYRANIKKIIEPYVQKSLEHYRLAIEKSFKIKVYSEWISKAYKGLASIELSRGEFSRFAPVSLFQETFYLPLIDETGTVTMSFIDGLSKSLKYGLSRSDFVRLSEAINSKRESVVLKTVSSILNKDINNIPAINSLAFFYLQKNRLGLAYLILNRLSDKESSNPVIMNNLAVIFLKYGKPRMAVNYLKKALSIQRSYDIAKVNLANIFIRQYDYQNAYTLYKESYSDIIKNKIGRTQKSVFLLNNYAVALTGSGKWSEGSFIFKNLRSQRAPLPESLFNYSCFLAEKSKGEEVDLARKNLLQAKGVVEELKTYNSKPRLKLKLKTLLQSISIQLKSLKRIDGNIKTRVQQRRK